MITDGDAKYDDHGFCHTTILKSVKQNDRFSLPFHSSI